MTEFLLGAMAIYMLIGIFWAGATFTIIWQEWYEDKTTLTWGLCCVFGIGWLLWPWVALMFFVKQHAELARLDP